MPIWSWTPQQGGIVSENKIIQSTIDQFRSNPECSWILEFILGCEASGNKTKEIILRPSNDIFVLFYSPKPRSQVWILIYRKWSIWVYDCVHWESWDRDRLAKNCGIFHCKAVVLNMAGKKSVKAGVRTRYLSLPILHPGTAGRCL